MYFNGQLNGFGLDTASASYKCFSNIEGLWGSPDKTYSSAIQTASLLNLEKFWLNVKLK